MPGSETRAMLARPAVGAGLLATALATLVVMAMLAVLLAVVTINAFGWFWPARIVRFELADGRVVVGEPAGRQRAEVDDGRGEVVRIRVKTGNREVAGFDHVWLLSSEVVRTDRPPDLVNVERRADGDAFGRLAAVVDASGRPVSPGDAAAVSEALAEAAALRDRRAEVRARADRLRRPLTRLEQELATLLRSQRAATPEAETRRRRLERDIERASGRVTDRIAPLAAEAELISRRLGAGRIVVEAGDLEVVVPLGEVLEVAWPNRLGLVERLLRTIRNGVRFLVTEPREANTEGGIYPALFGTVLMVLLMSIAVMPLGVVTAVYMTEYARPGPALRLANHAVNNLAGVPSIVIGMFGLAFFVYGVGGAIDQAMFEDRLPRATFGTGGILWASLTLALLTIPVVVVATREGLLAVPTSWREGSFALGATRWQTLRRIVLPAARPGILTGLILAVSRAAGEVAPLMLTGAVKLTHSLPVDGSPPFLHLERKFMHLGFHIYDVSMQSPSVEAAKPMAFATTLVLLSLVVVINLAAIIARRRLRMRYTVTEM